MKVHHRFGGRSRAILVAAAIAGGQLTSGLQAQVWTGTDGGWNTPSNWNSPPVSGPTTALTFNAAGTQSFTATNDIGPFTLNSITFNNTGTGLITLAGSPLTLGGVSPTISTVGSAQIDNALAGSSPIVKSGAGTLTLNGANTYTGGLNVSAGRLRIGNGGNTGNVGGGTINIAAGATFEFNRSDDITAANLFTGTGTIEVNNGILRQTSNSTGFTGTVVINSGGTFRTEAPSTHNFNAVSIVVNNGGTYVFGNNTIGDPNLPNTTYITANTGGQVIWEEGETFGGINLLGGSYALTQGGMTLNGASPNDFQAGSISGASNIGGNTAINKTTAGVVTVDGVNLNVTGGVNILDGAISTNAGFSNTGNLTLGSATTTGTLQLTGANRTIGKPIIVDAGGGVLDVDAATTITYSSIATGAGPLTKAGGGTLILTGNNTHTGPLTVSGGTLQIGNAGNSGAISTDVLNNGTVAISRAGLFNLPSAISGSGSVVINGADAASVTQLSGALTYTGTTTVNAGTLRIAPFSTGSGITVAGAAGLRVDYGASPTTLNTPTLSLGAAGATLNLTLATSTIPGSPLINVTSNDGLQLNGGTHTLALGSTAGLSTGTYTLIDYVGADITSGFSLAALPARTLGNLVYNTANTSIDLSISTADSITWRGDLSADWDAGTDVDVGGTLNWRLASNSATSTNFIAGDVVTFDDTATQKNVNLTAALSPFRVTVDTAGAYSFGGPGSITGGASLTKLGAGTLTIATNNDNTGSTTVTGGTLRIGGGGTTGSIGTGNITNNAAVVFDRSDAVTYAGNISGSGSLTKAGSNTLTLTGAMTATGPTTISGGTLALAPVSQYTLTSAIGGAGGLAKSGSTVVLTGNNTYAGTTAITAGTLQIGDGGTTGTLGAGDTAVTGTLAFNRSDDVTYAGGISGTGAVRQNGTGKMTLSGPLTYTGATTIANGTLEISSPSFALLDTAIAVGTNNLIISGPNDVEFNKVLTGTGTITKNGTGSMLLTQAHTGFTGTLVINGGNVQLNDAGAGGDFNAASIVVNDTGKFSFGPAGNPDLPANTIITLNPGGVSEFTVGEDYGGIVLDGGTYTHRVNNNLGLTSELRSGLIDGVEGTPGSFGGAGLIRKTTAGTVTINGSTINSTGGVSIEQGVLSTNGLIGGTTGDIMFGASVPAGTSGTLEYTGPSRTYARPVAINADGGTLSVTDPTSTLTITGSLAGGGTLTKTGTGTVALTGPLGHTGSVAVNQGVVRVLPVTSLGGFTVSGTGTLAVNSGAGGATFNTPSLSLNGAGATLRFELDTSTLPTLPLVNINSVNGLTAGGSIQIDSTQTLPLGSFTLIDYPSGSSPISSGFSLVLPPRTNGALVYDTAATQINVNVTGVDSILWNGNVAGGVWTTGTGVNVGGVNNFKTASTSAATNFVVNDVVRFDDTAAGSTTVDITTQVQPLALTVDNTSKNYTFFGAGGITGSTALVKSGAGSLTVATENTYTGGTTINAGTLQIGNGGSSGSLGNGVITNNGTLGVNRADSYTVPNAVVAGDGSKVLVTSPSPTQFSGGILANAAFELGTVNTTTLSAPLSGSGVVTKTGAGTLRLIANNNPFTGSLVINGGSVILTDDNGSGGDLGAASITVNSGGNFTFGSNPPLYVSENPDLPDSTFITVNTGGTVNWNIGENFGGLNINGGDVVAIANMTVVSTAAPSVFSSGTLSAGPLINPQVGGAGAITKTTPGTLIVNGIFLNNTGGLNIQEGTLATNASITNSGNLTFGTATTNGTLQIDGPGFALNKPTTFNAGGGTISVTEPGGFVTFGSSSTGAGGLTKSGPGTLVMTGAHTYTGATTVSAGTLQIGDGAAAGSIASDIVNNAAITFNRTDPVTFAGGISGAGSLTKDNTNTLTLTGPLSYSGATTVNSGTLRISPFNAGPITVAAGSTLAIANASPAATLSTPGLSLTGSNATIRLELDAAGNPTVPLIDVTGVNGLNLNGGTHSLTIANAKPLTTGSFTLIDYNGSAITSGFNLVGLSARITGSLVYDTANTRIDLNVSSVDSIVWNGNLSNEWDIGSAIDVDGTNNWKLASNSASTNFVQNDQVLFNDTASGTGAVAVTINDTVEPALVTVNNPTRDYSFVGGGVIGGTGSVVKQGAGTLTIGNDYTYSGGTTVSGGTLRIGVGGTQGAIGTGPLVNNAEVIIDRSNDVSLENSVSGTGNLTKLGTNALTLVGDYSLSGTTTITDGKLVVAPAGTSIFPGTTAGAGTLEVAGSGIFAATNTLGHTGGTLVTTGTLSIGAGGTTGSLNGNVTVASGATLAFNRSDSVTYDGVITSDGTVAAIAGTTKLTGNNLYNSGLLFVGPGATLEVQTEGFDTKLDINLNGQGTFVKTGSGVFTVTSSSTGFTGIVNVNAGTFRIEDDAAPGGGDLNAANIIVNNGGRFEFVGPTGNPDLPGGTIVTVNTGGVVEFTEGEDYGSIVLDGGTYNTGVNNNLGFMSEFRSGALTGIPSGSLAGAGGFRKSTTGTVVISNVALNGTGGLAIDEGTLNTNAAITTNVSIGTAGTQGTLQYSGATATLSVPVTLNAGGGVVNVSDLSSIYTMSGVVSGAGGLVKDGPGTLILGQVNSYAGATDFRGGVLQVNSLGNLGAGDAGIVFSGGTLQAGAPLDFPATGGTPTRVVSLTAATTGTVNTNGFPVAFNQNVTGAGSLAKTGPGTLTLAGTNTYTGGTSVTGGTLLATNSLASSTGPMLVTNANAALIAPKIAPSSLTIEAGASVRLTNVDAAGSLAGRSNAGTLANTGKLDVGSTGIVIANADPAAIRAQIIAGRGNTGGTGGWAGATGITSSTAQADNTNRAVGYTVSGSQVTVAQTLLGDANLDGRVNVLDRSAYLANAGGSGKGWSQADFNYDSITNVLDRGAYLAHAGQELPPAGGGGAFAMSIGGSAMLGDGVGSGNAAVGDAIPNVAYNPTTGKLTVDTDGLLTINAILLDVAASDIVSVVQDPDGPAGVAWNTPYYAGGQNWESSVVSAAGDLAPGVWEIATLKTGLTANAFGGQSLFGAIGHDNDIGFILSNGGLVSTNVEVVPEPATAGLLALAGIGLLARRRRNGSRA